MRPPVFLVTCEHGGNRVPAAYRPLFRGRAALLATHRGYDAGALDMARELAAALRAPLIASTVTRLLVELNRSPTHPALFSDVVRSAPPAVRARIYELYYLPYRTEVEGFVADAIARGTQVLHVSSHSFPPVLDGCARNADVALLYDPARPGEKAFCARWRAELAARLPAWRVRRNYPYRGAADGLTTYLRRRFGEPYSGVELEMNQKHVRAEHGAWRETRAAVAAALVASIATLLPAPARRARRATEPARP
jgi:predicted N-formylglutamate amidohydrolase